MLLIKGGTVKTITQGDIKDGEILIDEGKILAVGKGLDVPEGCEVYDASGMLVTPGLIDGHTGIEVLFHVVLVQGLYLGSHHPCLLERGLVGQAVAVGGRDSIVGVEDTVGDDVALDVVLDLLELGVVAHTAYTLDTLLGEGVADGHELILL